MQATTKNEGAWSSVDQYGHPKIPFRGYYDVDKCNKRRQWVEEFSSCSLTHVGQWWENEGQDDTSSCLKLKGNIENPIGLAKIPVGVAGPLYIRGDHVNGYVLCPYATTEGALVASATRGAATLTRAGGVTVKIIEKAIYRCPVFQLRSMSEVDAFLQWVSANFEVMKKRVRLFSQHASLLNIIPTRMGRTVILSLKYDTEDAAGQNMITSATWHICKWMIENVQKDIPDINVSRFWVESHLAGDKVSTHQSLTMTRGVHAQVEAFIPVSILESTLKVDVETLLELYGVWVHTNNYNGAIGLNINVANTLTAVFMATGQDVAGVVESSAGELIMAPLSVEEMKFRERLTSTSDKRAMVKPSGSKHGGLYVALTLPSLVVGTVGGGTNLATQKECLELMGCHGKNGVLRFAEIIACFALSLDLSTIASVANGQFASAHEKLGRNHPTHGLKDDQLNSDFFQKVLGEQGKVVNFEPFHINTGNSILSELTKSEMSKKVGHFGYYINFKNALGVEDSLRVVIKSKPTDTETCNMINKIAQGCGRELAVTYEQFKIKSGFRYCSIREVELCRSTNDTLRTFMPQVHYIECLPSKDLYVIVLELLSSEKFRLLDTVDDISVWGEADIKVVLRDIAKIHSENLNKVGELSSCTWLEKLDIVEMKQLWGALLKHAQEEFPEFWTPERVRIMESALANLQQVASELDSAPNTMIHNDCNPRNICLRKPIASSPSPTSPSNLPYSDPQCLCMYDWELATIGVPQHDLIEFLAFTLPPSTSLDKRLELIDFYRRHLEYYSGVEYPLERLLVYTVEPPDNKQLRSNVLCFVERFVKVYNLSCLDFAMNRLLMYTMVHTFKDYVFLPRVVNSHFTYIKQQMDLNVFTPHVREKTVSKL